MSLLETRDPMDERRPPPSTTALSFVKKLTTAQVRALKRAFKAGVPMARLARRFGVAT